MDINFWLERWQNNEIGFHQPRVNTYIQDYFDQLALAQGNRIFVPMCGKSLDLIWLQRQDLSVVAVEISPIAVNTFFKENALDSTHNRQNGFDLYSSDDIKIYVGDYFKLSSGQLGQLDAVYDRAALIAMPEQLRQPYIDQLARLLPIGKRVLLITLEYQQRLMTGPPFSVNADTVQQLTKDLFHCQLLVGQDVLQTYPGFAERGLDSLTENVFLLTRG